MSLNEMENFHQINITYKLHATGPSNVISSGLGPMYQSREKERKKRKPILGI